MNAEATTPAVDGQVLSSLSSAATQLRRLEQELSELELCLHESIDAVPASHRESARNLVHYLALRQRDLRDLQQQLAQLGLSSLGRSESSVLRALLEVSTRVRESLARMAQDDAQSSELGRLQQARAAAMSWQSGKDSLERHTNDVFGTQPADRHVYIMVTAPSADEADAAWMTKLLRAGMNVLRINCAHEAEKQWARVIEALEQARQETGMTCRIVMDLAGPKIRTGAIKAERRIATWKPPRDDIGMPTAPVRVVLGRASASHSNAALILSDKEFMKLREGDELRFRDARDRKRSLLVEQVRYERIVSTTTERAYLRNGVQAQLHRGKKHKDDVSLTVSETDDPAIDVQSGDPLILTPRDCTGSAPTRDPQGRVETPGVIACTLPAALAQLKVGHRVLLDDGRIHATVEQIVKHSGDFLLRVARTYKPTAKLRAGKGINLPDTLVAVAGFTKEDRAVLPFIFKHADAVGLSFVRTASDVRALHEELGRLGHADKKLGVVLKIETRAGFENLPRLLLEGLRRPPLAVMIARGDLAVEVGFERLAELQQEMLWLCEASHVPAIWATQVLDMLARTGVPSRAEVTDAAESVAAECVMLNKGPHVAEAVSALVDILRRMEQHRDKKRSLFRRLHVSALTEG
jgi:pyruvate kinase